MSAKPDDDRAWHFWKQAQASIEAIEAEMQLLAAYVTQYPPIEIPAHRRTGIRRNVKRFSEKFNLLLHEQKRKVRA